MGMNFYSGLDDVYLLLSISHMESGLHGVTFGIGSGLSLSGTEGTWQPGW